MPLPPQCVANTPLDLGCREGVEAARRHRCKRGRTLAEVSTSGCAGWLRARALAVCRHEGLDGRFQPLDTTSLALRGDAVPEPGVEAMPLTHGDSKAHRPDGHQAIVALLVSQDGGGPLVRTSWEGHTSETPRVQERAQALLTTWKHAPTPS